MNGELSGGKNGILYERTDAAQAAAGLNAPVYGPRRPEPLNIERADIAMAFGMLICGFLYWKLTDIASPGLGVTLFAVILCTAATVYLKAAGLRQSKSGLAFLGIIALSAANFALFDGMLIKALNFIFLSLCFVYWICISSGMRLESRLSIYILSDMLRQLFVIPFYNFTGCFRGIKQIFAGSQKGKGVLSGVLGLLFFLPVLILVITLLTDADAAFQSVMEKLRFSLSENMLESIRDAVLGLPVACYLFGLIYGDRYRRMPGKVTLESETDRINAFHIVPGVTVYSALTALSLVYLVFFLAQTTYLFSAFRESLPQAMTYAGYARRGFFELCAVSGINLAVLALAHLIVKRNTVKILKGETAVLCGFTVLLIITAMSKMGMYIEYYGLTRLRAYTSWFMIVLLFLFVIILLRQFRSFSGTRIVAVIFICLFLALCYGNIDGMIAKYNIDRYRAGTLESLDVKAFSELSDGAVPYLYELYRETADPAMKAELKAVIERPSYESIDGGAGFRDFNLQKYKADQIREEIRAEI